MATSTRSRRRSSHAPAIDYYVVTRYANIEAVFLDPETYSASPAQLPLAQLVPEAVQILLGGHRPQPSMVSLDPSAHTRLRSPAARALTPRRVGQENYLIGNVVRRLLEEPARWHAVVADPALIPGAVADVREGAKLFHYCLDAALGKLEAQLALEALTRRLPRLRLVEGQTLSFHPNISFRGPQALRVQAA